MWNALSFAVKPRRAESETPESAAMSTLPSELPRAVRAAETLKPAPAIASARPAAASGRLKKLQAELRGLVGKAIADFGMIEPTAIA